MESLTVLEVIDIAARIGIGSLLALLLFFGNRRVWVYGWTYDAKAEEADYWRGVAERLLNIAETTTEALPPSVTQQPIRPRHGTRSGS